MQSVTDCATNLANLYGAELGPCPQTLAGANAYVEKSEATSVLSAALSLTGAAYYQNHKSDVGNPWLFSVGADYALSKRTDAYLNLAYAKNSSNALLPIGVAQDTTPAVVVNPDGTTSSSNQMAAMVGIRHKF